MSYLSVTRKIADSCPKYENIRENNHDRPQKPRCDQCVHWYKGSCEMFLAKGK